MLSFIFFEPVFLDPVRHSEALHIPAVSAPVAALGSRAGSGHTGRGSSSPALAKDIAHRRNRACLRLAQGFATRVGEWRNPSLKQRETKARTSP